MRKEIYLIRHGRTEYNKLGIWQGSGVDSSLDKIGQLQAEKFYNRYKDIEFDLIIHSSLKRSKETVSAFLKLGKEAKESALINEISWGIFEGKPHTRESLENYNRVVTAWGNGDFEIALQGGESAKELELRMVKFVQELKQFPENKILICSHGRAIRALLCVMKNEPLSEMEKYQHANTGLFQAYFDNEEFVFNSYNNTDHLEFQEEKLS